MQSESDLNQILKIVEFWADLQSFCKLTFKVSVLVVSRAFLVTF
jgi:hypothetical protein